MTRSLQLLSLLWSGLLALGVTSSQNITNYRFVTNIEDGNMFRASDIGEKTNKNVTRPLLLNSVPAKMTNATLPSATRTNGGILASNQFLINQTSLNRTRDYKGPPFCFALLHGRISETYMLTEAANCAQLNLGQYIGKPVLYFDYGWYETNRDANGHLIPISAHFPHGLPWLATNVNNLGCLFGLYIMSGDLTNLDTATTPPNFSASTIQTAYIDGQDLASYGVDYVRVDGGQSTVDYQKQWISSFIAGFESVRNATNGVPKPWLLEMSIPHNLFPDAHLLNKWIPTKVNVFRTCGDQTTIAGDHISFYSEFDHADATIPYCRPGCYPTVNGTSLFFEPNQWMPVPWYDVDDLHVIAGVLALRHSQISIADDPSYIAANQENPAWLTVMTNPFWLEMWRDPMAVQAYPVSITPSNRVYVSPLANGDWGVGLWNRTTNSIQLISCDFTNLIGLGNKTNILKGIDIFSGWTVDFTNIITAQVSAHCMNVYRVGMSSKPSTNKTGY
jgi:hypothetical protein